MVIKLFSWGGDRPRRVLYVYWTSKGAWQDVCSAYLSGVRAVDGVYGVQTIISRCGGALHGLRCLGTLPYFMLLALLALFVIHTFHAHLHHSVDLRH